MKTDVPTTKHRKSRIPRDALPRLPCPACQFGRLIDTGRRTKSLTYRDGDPGYGDADYYQKCSNCSERIGIRKIE